MRLRGRKNPSFLVYFTSFISLDHVYFIPKHIIMRLYISVNSVYDNDRSGMKKRSSSIFSKKVARKETDSRMYSIASYSLLKVFKYSYQ